MAVSQNECYRLITLGYLSGFTNQAGVTVNVSSLAAAKRVNTYCPTYGELTGGTLVPNWKQGTTPNGDTDGIVVSQKWYGDTSKNYTSDQCVDQKDLSVKWTRLETFTIAANPTSISGCSGETSVISYNHKYTRYTKEMNASCASATSSVSVTDTADSEVNISVASADGSIGAWSGTTHTKPFTSKAYSGTGDKTITISGDVIFRGAHNLATAKITQKSGCGPDCGEYKWVQSGTPVSSYTVECEATSQTAFTCDGGNYSASGRGKADIVTTYVYKDDCDNISGSPSSTTVTTYTALPSQSGTFTELDCCGGDQTRTSYLTFEYNNAQGMVQFKQECKKCTEGCEADCTRIVDDGCWFEGGNLRPTAIYAFGAGTSSWGESTDTAYVDDLTYNGVQLTAYTQNNPLELTSWLKVYRDSTAIGQNGDLKYFYEPYIEDENPSADEYHKYREAVFFYETKDEKLKYGSHSGEPACSSTMVIVRQVLCGYDICKTGSHYEYTTIKKGHTCCESPYSGDCKSGCTDCKTDSQDCLTAYTFTVKTVPTAIVTMGGKTYYANAHGLVIHTSDSSASVNATISKNGCTFDGSTTKTVTVAANTTVEVPGVCESCLLCTDANIRDITTMSPLSSTSGGGVVLTFITNCGDASKYQIRHISGAVILKSISMSYYAAQHRMIVSASYDANTFSTSRAENLGITFNGTICKTLNIVQKAKNS